MQFVSVSSVFLSCITMDRNPNGSELGWVGMPKEERKFPNVFKILAAEAGYICVVPFAIVEAALFGIATLAAMCIPSVPDDYRKLLRDVSGSAGFSVIWALFNSIFNPLLNDMIATEKVARAAAESGNPFVVSPEYLH